MMNKHINLLIFSLLFCIATHGAEHNELEMEYHALAHTEDKSERFIDVDWLNDNQLASIDAHNVVKMWDVETGQCTLEAETNEYTYSPFLDSGIVTNPAQPNLVACSYDTADGLKRIAIRDMRTGEATQVILNTHSTRPVCWDPFGDKLLATSSFGGHSRIYDLRTNRMKKLFPSNIKAFWLPEGLVYTENPQHLRIRFNISKTNPPEDNYYNFSFLDAIANDHCDEVTIEAIAQQPTTSLCTLACTDGLRFCDIQKVLRHEHPIRPRNCRVSMPSDKGFTSIAWHPNGHYFVTCDRKPYNEPKKIKLWEKDKPLNEAHIVAQHPHEQVRLRQTPFCPNGNLIAASTDYGKGLGVYRMPNVALLAAATNGDEEE